MIRVKYSNGEVGEYSNTYSAAMEATQAIIASQGYITPIQAYEVLEELPDGSSLERKLTIKLGLVEFSTS